MPRIIHPEETEEKAEKHYEAETIASFKPDEATEQHETDVYMSQNFDDNASGYWQQEQRAREERQVALVAKLDEPIPAELLKQRKAPGEEGRKGKMLTYATWHTIVRRLNQYFGHDGWTTKVQSITTYGEESGGAPKFVAAVVVLTVRWPNGGTSTFTNTGTGVNSSGNWFALEMAYKDAVHDGIKRCATALGDAFGLNLYEGDVPVAETGAETGEDVVVSASTLTEKGPVPIRKFKADYPVQAEEETAECEGCGREIKGYTAKTGKSYTTAQLVNYSKQDADGHIFCYSCKQDYLASKKAR